MIILMFTVYAKYFFGAAIMGLFFELFKTLLQARRERKEYVESKEVVVSSPIVLVEEAPIVKEVVRENPTELTTSEVEYIENDKKEAPLRREKAKSTGPPEVA